MSGLDFLNIKREENYEIKEEERIKSFLEFHKSLEKEKRESQASRCMNCGVPFCGTGEAIKGITIGCPLHNYIPEWNKLLAKGLYEEAYKRLMLTTSFPEFTGRVCPALCEVACVQNIDSLPVTVKDNELFIIENAFKNNWVKPNVILNKTNKDVCVIGSGPAGLALANELNKLGHNVTVYEKSDRLGGLLMYGIPNMKLDKSIIDRRIKIMEESGIKFVTSFDATNKDNIKEVNKYDAICFATGTGKNRDLIIKGRELKNIMFATDYLTDSTKTLLDKNEVSTLALNKNVLVIGGGDTGNDCVATAIRQKASSVIQFEIMPKPSDKRTNSWPEWPNALKVDYGAKEAIYLEGKDIRMFSTTALEFVGKDSVSEVKYASVKRELVDGKYQFVNVKGSEGKLKVDLVILAMGFLGTSDELFLSYNLPKSERGNIKAFNHRIENTKYFVTGDALTGQSLVVKAIDDARKCAKNIDEFLR